MSAVLPSDLSVALAGGSRQRLFWLLHGGGWSGVFLLSFLAALSHGKPLDYYRVSLAVAVAGFLTTLGIRHVLRRAWPMSPVRLVALGLPLTLVAAGVMSVVFVSALGDWCHDCRPVNLTGYVAYSTSYIYMVLSWIGLYVGIKYYRQLQAQTRQALAADAKAHQAQLKMLRYQLNPHFLFNTLNAISTLILDRDQATANRMVQGLSALLRYSLDSDPMQRVTLKQELGALHLYLDIEKVRFAERLHVDIEVGEDCYPALLPSLLLQPLVENAVKHAIAPQTDGGSLRIMARRDANTLHLSVADSGPGCPDLRAGELPQGNGVGLRNTCERMRVLYGDRGAFVMRNREGGGCVVELSLPFETGAHG